jgi:hypothetical protein
MKFFLLVLLILLQFSCTRLETLNLKPHYYSQRPSNIIWIQLAGFTDQHLPLLRFDNPDASYHTQFESADCLGKMWSFNLYDLRPKAASGFLSQMTGTKNLKGTCEDYSKRPVWNYFEEEKYRISILENGATSDESIEKILTCTETQKKYLKNVKLIRMGPEMKDGIGSFHYQNALNTSQEPAGVYYDKSCQHGVCYSTFFDNAKKILANIASSGTLATQNFYLLRDFTYLKALRKNDLLTAKAILRDLDKLLLWIDTQNRTDLLVIITGTEGLEIDFPKEGKEWLEYVRLNKNINIKNSTLMSTVFAKGPMAENFCGLYDEAEVIQRILYKPIGKKFSWDALNPLSN